MFIQAEIVLGWFGWFMVQCPFQQYFSYYKS